MSRASLELVTVDPELSALLRGAITRVGPLRAELRRWYHFERGHRVLERGVSPMRWSPSKREDAEDRWRVQFAPPDRFRRDTLLSYMSEPSDEHHEYVRTSDGERFWLIGNDDVSMRLPLSVNTSGPLAYENDIAERPTAQRSPGRGTEQLPGQYATAMPAPSRT